MTKLFYTDKPIIGLDISSTGIKIMAINTKRWLVLGYGSLDLDPIKMKESLEGNSTYLAENIQLLIKEKLSGTLPSNHVAIGIPTFRSYSRTFTLPTSVEHKLKDAVELEVDQYIPVPSSTLYIDYRIIERKEKEIVVLMSAVPRTIVDKCAAAAESAGLIVSLIEPGMSAVSRLITKTEEGHLPTVIVDIGPASTDIAIIDDGNVKVTGGLTIGGNTFTLDIAKKLNIALENAHQLKVLNGLSAGPRQIKIKGALEPSLKKIIVETHKVMRYYSERISSDKKIEQLLVVGSGSNVPGIGEYFTENLIMPARVASPWQKLNFGELPEPARQFRARYLTVAGLASITKPELPGIISLLSYKAKTQISAARTNVILMKFTGVLAVAVIFLALASGYSYMFLENLKTTANSQSTTSRQESGYDINYASANSLKKTIDTGGLILDKQTVYSKIITDLASAMPDGMVLQALQLEESTLYTKPLDLTFRAKDTNTVDEFRESILQQSSTFSGYTQISLTTNSQDTTGYPTELKINLTINRGLTL